MVPRPTSPTSLLWAHQLKREHTFLLDRIRAIEESVKRQNSDSRVVESLATKASTLDLAKLSARVNAFEKDNEDVRQWLKKLNAETQARLDAEVAQVERLAAKVALLEVEARRVREKKESFDNDKALLKRIETLETAGAQQAQLVQKIKESFEEADVDVLRRRVHTLETHNEQTLAEWQQAGQRLTAQEAVNVDLRKDHENSEKRPSVDKGEQGHSEPTSGNVVQVPSSIGESAKDVNPDAQANITKTKQTDRSSLQTETQLRRSRRFAKKVDTEGFATQLLRCAEVGSSTHHEKMSLRQKGGRFGPSVNGSKKKHAVKSVETHETTRQTRSQFRKAAAGPSFLDLERSQRSPGPMPKPLAGPAPSLSEAHNIQPNRARHQNTPELHPTSETLKASSSSVAKPSLSRDAQIPGLLRSKPIQKRSFPEDKELTAGTSQYESSAQQPARPHKRRQIPQIDDFFSFSKGVSYV
ncbi:hypothetical protein LTR66_001047 [Elasticomyces elasticus]|nr:hypothetical protein LTR50_002479 [Elasticomyces elasticus]KAK5000005.1 hypothetical protein LTR66_001047 [Elasticomyces elasticus]